MTMRPALIHQHPIWKMAEGLAPVRDLEVAIAYFSQVLGFTVERPHAGSALVRRDVAHLTLVVDPRHDPGSAGSCAWRTTDLTGLHAELTSSGAAPGAIKDSIHDGKAVRVFFVREDTHGYCFCFSQTVGTTVGPASA